MKCPFPTYTQYMQLLLHVFIYNESKWFREKKIVFETTILFLFYESHILDKAEGKLPSFFRKLLLLKLVKYRDNKKWRELLKSKISSDIYFIYIYIYFLPFVRIKKIVKLRLAFPFITAVFSNL